MVALKRWSFPIQSPLSTNSFTRRHQRRHHSLKGREAFFESGRSNPHLILEEGAILHRDTLNSYAYLYGAINSTESISADVNDVKGNIDRKSLRASHSLSGPTTSANLVTSTTSNYLHLSLLMENLNELEDTFAGTDLVRLERDILVHIGRLGALKLFYACLSRTLMTRRVVNPNFLLTGYSRNCPIDSPVGEQKGKIILRTGKKEQRKLRRTRGADKVAEMSSLSTSSKKIHKVEEHRVLSLSGSSGSMASSKSKRVVIAKNESEMSVGVKEVAELERIRANLEEQIGQAASSARWAEAAGIDRKTLQQRLQFGWYCRDKLIGSTRSLVVYLAKNYRGMGIAFDDLLQAGSMGVLKGAERYDHTRGYRFSTYVQYWIRKSMLALVAHHSRGIRIPASMGKIMKRLQKARRTFYDGAGRYPQDDETADITGISLANVRLASKCSRVVGSIHQEIGNGWCTKFMEVTLDASVKTPDEIITRQFIRNDICKLLEGLHPRERQVLVLRYGLDDGRFKSLEEIGRLSRVTKEWIRKVEKAALAKIRREEIQRELKYYI